MQKQILRPALGLDTIGQHWPAQPCRSVAEVADLGGGLRRESGVGDPGYKVREDVELVEQVRERRPRRQLCHAHKKNRRGRCRGGSKNGLLEGRKTQTFWTRPALMAFTETQTRLMEPLGSLTRMR